MGTELSRRGFLAGVAGAGALAAAGSFPTLASAAPAQAVAGPSPFTLGVASGQPRARSLVLWTRLAPDPLAPGSGLADETITVRWQLARDESFATVVQEGRAFARPSNGHTIHVDVAGLQPGTEYFYRFRAMGEISTVGRTKTAPAIIARPNLVRFAFASCQNWQQGLWPAYLGLAAEEDLDFVVHLGDYIYESGISSTAVRQHNSAEPTTLEGYRLRHALYKSDPAIQAAHALAPWITVWDDHETENNYAGDRDENGSDPATFLVRRAAAYRAYWENMPFSNWEQPSGPFFPIYRRFGWGNLLALNAVDTRQYRTDQPCNGAQIAVCDGMFDPAATLLGAEQKAWLKSSLAQPGSTWNVIANQVMFAPFDYNPTAVEQAFNPDQWDGYQAERQELVSHMATVGTSNPVVLTGDIHSSWVHEVHADVDDFDSPIVATEFVGTSISSSFPAALAPLVQSLLPANPGCRYFDGLRRGYVSCTVTPTEWRSDFRTVADALVATSPTSTTASFVVEAGNPGAVQV